MSWTRVDLHSQVAYPSRLLGESEAQLPTALQASPVRCWLVGFLCDTTLLH